MGKIDCRTYSTVPLTYNDIAGRSISASLQPEIEISNRALEHIGSSLYLPLLLLGQKL